MRYRVISVDPSELFVVSAPTEEEAWDKAVEEAEGTVIEITCIGYE